MGTDTRLQRERLYDAGASAFEGVAASTGLLRDHPEVRGSYVCPLCLHAYPRPSLDLDPPQLTIEHVPPKAAARGPITKVLSCQSCNNLAGGKVEHQLKRRRDVEDFGRGTTAKPLVVDLEVGDGTRTRASVTFEDGDLRIVGAPEASHPDAVEASKAWWDRQVEEQIQDSRFTVHIPGFDPHRSNVALLKTAYLAAFAAFGYRYIWRPTLDVVRAEINEPERHLRRIPALTSNDLDPTEHRLLTTQSPVRALGVQVGQQVIFLPWIDSSAEFWDRVHSLRSEQPGPTTVTFDTSGSWPRFPEYRLDSDRPNSGG